MIFLLSFLLIENGQEKERRGREKMKYEIFTLHEWLQAP